jgi:hypothetical protein
VGRNHVGYDLLWIFAEMWERRDNCCGAGKLFDSMGTYSGKRFTMAGLPKRIDGDGENPDSASLPWDWDDNDDDMPRGEWFMDPADYQDQQFTWAEPFSRDYVFHPFLNSELCGDIFNGQNNMTTLRHGPYTVVCDVTIAADQQLEIKPGVTVRFAPGARIKVDGRLYAFGSDGAIRFESAVNPAVGMAINGDLFAQKGGEIAFSANCALQFASMTTLGEQNSGGSPPVMVQTASAEQEGSPKPAEAEAPEVAGEVAETVRQLFLPAVQP